MKVLMLGWELPPHNSGGLGVACYHLCKHLSRQGVDIEFILPYDAEHDVDFMTISPLSYKRREAQRRQHVGAYSSHLHQEAQGKAYQAFHDQQDRYEEHVAKLAQLGEFDIIHAHDWLTFRAAQRAKAISGKPLVVHIHATEHDRAAGARGNPLVREIEETAMLMADRVVTVSNTTKEIAVEQYGIPPHKIEVVHNCIDIDTGEQIDDANAYHYIERMKADGYRVVVNVGRLTIQKGLTHLLRAAQLVVERQPKTLFLIVGSGEQYYELIELAAELGISENVIFTGFLRGKKWRDSLRIGDIFVMPSVSEPFGLAPLEAISYGTPALISKQAGVSEVLMNALKIDFWDEQAMANQLLAVINNDVLRDELAQNSSRELERLSWSGAAESFVDLYKRHMEVYT